MTTHQKIEFLTTYRNGLLNDVLPFWISNSVDHEYGGFIVALNQDGSILDTDKGMWQQCRFTWLLSTLYNTLEGINASESAATDTFYTTEQRDQWLVLAKHGIEFISKHGFDEDGRMFFQVTH